MTFDEWSRKWHIAQAALDDLTNVAWEPPPVKSDGSEAFVQSQVRLKAAKLGLHLWRNNVGAAEMARGGYVRYGLANDSPRLNAVLKSADLIGWRPHVVVPSDVGRTLAVFLSVECKAPNWRPGSDPRYPAQLRWAALVARSGGESLFATSPDSLLP